MQQGRRVRGLGANIAAGGVALLLVLAAGQVQAQQYRWIDERGRVQYTDTPPPPTAKGVQKKHFDAGKSDGPAEPYALQVARKAAPVKLYTSPDCGEGCDDSRNYLNQRGIPFTEISVVTDKDVAELRALSGRAGVPVMFVGNSMLRGFNEGTYDSAFDIAGYPKKGTLPVRNQTAPPPPKPAAKSAPKPAAQQPQ